MTALDQYVRLESDGRWRADAAAGQRDVAVSFGDATLVIADPAGRPLAHWSLAALTRHNPGQMPAIFAPDAATGESLEIADDTMVAAIDQVQKALMGAPPRAGRLRGWLIWSGILALVALGLFWMPDALRQQTRAIVPDAKAAQIGQQMLTHLSDLHGAPCASGPGLAALAQLKDGLFGAGAPVDIIIMANLGQPAIALPGEMIALDVNHLRSIDDRAVGARWVRAAHSSAMAQDPLLALLHAAPLSASFWLLTTGVLPDAVVQDHLAALLNAAPQPLATAEIAGDALLSDSAWIALQNICNG